MAFAQNFVFIFLPVLLLLINPGDSKCPPSFECGKLGTLGFPLTNRPECGLFMMDNCSTDDPVVHLGSRVYLALKNVSTNGLLVLDFQLQSDLNTTGVCNVVRGSYMPSAPSITFIVSPNLTIYDCVNPSEEALRRPFENYNHTSCPSYPFNAYYGINQGPVVDYNSYNCSTIQFPIFPNPNPYANLSDLLAYQYVIEWNVSDECSKCHREGGQCLSNTNGQFHCEKGVVGPNRVALIVSIVFLVAVMAAGGLLFFFCFSYCKKRGCCSFNLCSLIGIGAAKTKQERDIELFLANHGELAQRRYKYAALKKMTKSFSEKLGAGGYGSVYKGKLPDGRLVAVKVLNDLKGDGEGEEFMNEVASISQTSHFNVVTLLGFSFDGSKRALIYDFMPNGSLEKYIQNSSASSSSARGSLENYIQNSSASSSSAPGCSLGWEILFQIALGIARGLDYLHQGCTMRILHFDIKPHNILLDKDFNPKISDFGLAKLCPNRTTSIVSMMGARGTIGYIAPEVFCSNFGDVSYKSDVFSYGMMILEMAGERRNVRGDTGSTSETRFPHSVYKQLEIMDDRLDHGIKMNEDGSELAKRKLVIVGLWCIQTDPKDRPSMSKVVAMLEGNIESLQIPPKPYLSSPPRLGVDFSMTS